MYKTAVLYTVGKKKATTGGASLQGIVPTKYSVQCCFFFFPPHFPGFVTLPLTFQRSVYKTVQNTLPFGNMSMETKHRQKLSSDIPTKKFLTALITVTCAELKILAGLSAITQLCLVYFASSKSSSSAAVSATQCCSLISTPVQSEPSPLLLANSPMDF